MAFLGSILRARRGDFNLFLIAALVALLVVPGATHATLPPQGCEAVLFWLQSETAATVEVPVVRATSLVAISHQQAETPAPLQTELLSVASAHCGQFQATVSSPSIEPQLVPATPTLERHAVARLSGVRTNRRLI